MGDISISATMQPQISKHDGKCRDGQHCSTAGASAKAVATTANKTFNKLGVTVEARLVTELGFASNCKFEIESENRMPVKSAQTSPVQICQP